MEFRTSTCSDAFNAKLILGGCNGRGGTSYSLPAKYNSTYPTPIPRHGSDNVGECDCTEEWTTALAGANWTGGLEGGYSSWQGTSLDLATVQTFTDGAAWNYSECGKNYGFKNVTGKKQWHGMFGWTSNDYSPQSTSVAPDQTKYRTQQVTCTYENSTTIHGSPVYFWRNLVDCDLTRTVDANSGIITQSGKYDEDDYITVVDTLCHRTDLSFKCGTFSTFEWDGETITETVNPARLDKVYPLSGFTPPWSMSPAKEGAGWIDADINADVHGSSDLPTIDYWISYFNDNFSSLTKPAGNSWNISETYTNGYFDVTLDITVSRTATVYTWDFLYTLTWIADGGSDSYIAFSGTKTLSNAYTVGTIVTDIEDNMLSTWDMGAKYYPWRQDKYTPWSPLVTRKEVQANVQPIDFYLTKLWDYRSPLTDPLGNEAFSESWSPYYETLSWFDPMEKGWVWITNGEEASALDPSHIDGSIIGAPLLYDSGAKIGWGYFDFWHREDRYCVSPTGYSCTPTHTYQNYIYRYGGTLADCIASACNPAFATGPQLSTILPVCSTHWVKNDSAHSLPRGASRGRIAADGAIYIVKWAESRIGTPSYNFFRPCGADRVLVDETKVRCLDADGNMSGELTGLDLTKQVLIAFSDADDGIYTGCTQADIGGGKWSITLGTKICDLPTDYFHVFEEWYSGGTMDNCGMVGLVRFPDAWPICGRASVVVSAGNETNGVKLTFGTAQTNLRVGDVIDLYDSTDTETVTNKAIAARDSDTVFYLDEDYSGAIVDSVWVKSHGAPDWHWNDIKPKYEFRVGEWTTSNRDAEFSSTVAPFTECMAPGACSPAIVVFSPNTESFPVARHHKYWFTGDFVADAVFGSIQQLNVEFSITDPMYQTPACPCANGATRQCVQDDGTCRDDEIVDGVQVIYYPPSPRVEAMAVVPVGSPALATGITWPAMTPPAIPGVEKESFALPMEPWTLLQNEQAHCDETCRWWKYYYC